MPVTLTYENRTYTGRWITIDGQSSLAVDYALRLAMNANKGKKNTTLQRYLDMNIIQFVPKEMLSETEETIVNQIKLSNRLAGRQWG